MPVKDDDNPAVSGQRRVDREALVIRKAKRAEEAVSAVADYEQNQRATLERTAQLRAARLAQSVVPAEAKPQKSKRPVGVKKSSEAKDE